MKIISHWIWAQFLIICLSFTASAQVSSEAPTNYFTTAGLNYGFFGFHNKLDNSFEIRQELLDANTINLIARANGLSKSDLDTIQLAPGPIQHVPEIMTNAVYIYQIGRDDKAYKILVEQLGGYVSERHAGHGKSFLFAAITNRLGQAGIGDPDLRAIMTNQPWLPVVSLRKEDSFAYTNLAGQIISVSTSTTFVNGKAQTVSVTNMPKVDVIMRSVSYSTIDGELGWWYSFDFNPNGQIESSRSSCIDPIDIDPKYKSLLKAIDDEIDLQMKRDNVHGLGSVHTYWRFKKQKLKAKGIEWRSPGELNPDTIYD